jgi:hypothetical protein
MDYTAKYLKYKQKYLNLKNSMGGSNKQSKHDAQILKKQQLRDEQILNEKIRHDIIQELINNIQFYIQSDTLYLVSIYKDELYLINLVNYDEFIKYLTEIKTTVSTHLSQEDKDFVGLNTENTRSSKKKESEIHQNIMNIKITHLTSKKMLTNRMFTIREIFKDSFLLDIKKYFVDYTKSKIKKIPDPSKDNPTVSYEVVNEKGKTIGNFLCFFMTSNKNNNNHYFIKTEEEFNIFKNKIIDILSTITNIKDIEIKKTELNSP